MECLGGALKAAIAKAAELTAGGTQINYICSTFRPGDGRCTCPSESGSASGVRRLNDEAGILFREVVPAMDLTP